MPRPTAAANLLGVSGMRGIIVPWGNRASHQNWLADHIFRSEALDHAVTASGQRFESAS